MFETQGRIKAPCHIDVIYKDATLELDGAVVLDKGVLAENLG